ncbi:MAG: hypothetical protein JW765_06440 [Deltaproteobacteria bacterium]|nr:hypothetical protein [Candidatus Zymogenaceae bacterium]
MQGKKIIESMNVMGWTALGLGEKDFALGVDYLKDLEKTAKFPFLAANILDAETNKYVFEPYTVVKLNGFRVGITSVIGKDTNFSVKRQEKLGIYVADPANSLAAVLKELANKSDFIVVLSHTGLVDAKVLAKGFNNIDLMIVGHGGSINLFQPITERRTLLTEVFARGKYIDRLDFSITNPVRPYDFFVVGSDKSDSFENRELLMRKKQLDVFIADIEAQKKAGKDVSNIEKVVTDEMKQVEEKIEEMGKASGKEHPNTVKATLIALDSGLEDDPDVRGIFKKYADKLKEIKNQEKESLLKGGARDITSLAVEPHYTGMESCRMCHAKIYSFVSGTAHPKAYETLREKERQFEPDCIGCHTTGYRKPGGFTNILTAKDLLGVQCEVCHGPGSLHVKDNTANKMKSLTAAADCISCHDPENDDNFVYAEDLKKIMCPAP